MSFLIKVDYVVLSRVETWSIFFHAKASLLRSYALSLLSRSVGRWVALWLEWLWNRRVEYWAIYSSVCSFARTAHSFACSALLALLARSAAFLRSHAHSLAPELMDNSFCLLIERVDFIQIQPAVDPQLTGHLVFFSIPPCLSSCWSIHPKRDELMDELMDWDF